MAVMMPTMATTIMTSISVNPCCLTLGSVCDFIVVIIKVAMSLHLTPAGTKRLFGQTGNCVKRAISATHLDQILADDRTLGAL